MRVAAQHEVDFGTDLEGRGVALDLQHDARAVVEVDDREPERREERGRHRVVDHVGVDDAVAGDWLEHELRAAAADAVRVDRRRGVDRAAIDAASTEQPEDLVGTADELRALAAVRPSRTVSPLGTSTFAGAQHLGVRRRVDRRRGPWRGRTAPGTGPSALITTPVARPPPKPMIATRPAVSSAAIPPRSGAAAPVSPTSAYTAADAGVPAPSCFATAEPSRPSGSGIDQPVMSSVDSCEPRSRIVGMNTSSRKRRGS